MRRRAFISLLGATVTWPHSGIAQLTDKMRRIAMLSGISSTDPEVKVRVAALRQGLEVLGWMQNRNIRIDFRWSIGSASQMRAYAKELVESKPDLIVGMTTPAVAALVQETRSIPIVFVQVVDPVGRGFISNLARPGGNITGFVNLEFSMGGK